jgi:protein-tyrosine phosphatase
LILRSKTGENYYSSLYPDYEFKSAGTNLKLCQTEGTNPLTEEMRIWADTVFVMKNKHLQLIKQNTSNKYQNKIIVLTIDDLFK